MHGLIFETSVCYWQNQPGCYPEVIDCSPILSKLRIIDYDIQRTTLVLFINAHEALRFASFKRKRAYEHFHAVKRSNSTTNSLLPSLSSILKQGGDIMHVQQAAISAPPIRIDCESNTAM